MSGLTILTGAPPRAFLADAVFQTKPQIALDQLRAACC